MYPVEQGWRVWRGQWHWQVVGSHTLSAAIHSALSRVLLQTHLNIVNLTRAVGCEEKTRPAGRLMIILETVAVSLLQLTPALAALMDLHLHLAAPHVVLPVGPLGLDEHDLHRVKAGEVGDAGVGRSVAGSSTPLHHHMVRHDLEMEIFSQQSN